MTIDEILEQADILLADTGPSERAKKFAQAIKDRFIPNTCGMIEPETVDNEVQITDEAVGFYTTEEASAYATALFRKVDEIDSRDKK